MGRLPNGPVYQLFNLVGGLAVAVNVAAHHAVPSTVVNGIWAIVAVVVLVRMARSRRAAQRGVPDLEADRPVLHAEPPATTAVLPVVGPALRDHEPDATERTHAAPRLQAGTELPAPDAPVAAAPMTESIPVITATIALALVAAAQEQSDRRPDRRADHQEAQGTDGTHQHPTPTSGPELRPADSTTV